MRKYSFELLEVLEKNESETENSESKDRESEDREFTSGSGLKISDTQTENNKMDSNTRTPTCNLLVRCVMKSLKYPFIALLILSILYLHDQALIREREKLKRLHALLKSDELKFQDSEKEVESQPTSEPVQTTQVVTEAEFGETADESIEKLVIAGHGNMFNVPDTPEEPRETELRTENNEKISKNSDENPTCDNKLGFKGQFKTIPLVSLPGAGNTWVRHLIEQSTGLLTGSVYSDGALARTLKGEMTSFFTQQTIVTKAHSINRVKGMIHRANSDLPISGCVLIIRSPRDAMLAEFSRRTSRSHVSGINLASLKSPEWQDRHMYTSEHFIKVYQDAIKFCPTYKLILYEDLKQSKEKLISVMQETVEFFNQINQFSGPDEIKFTRSCLEKNMEGHYHRKNVRDWDVADYMEKKAIENLNFNVARLNKTFGVLPESYLVKEKVVEVTMSEEVTTTKASKLEPAAISEDSCSVKSGDKGQFNIIPLLSLPGSGNTWVRYLIEQSTGFWTGSMYHDPVLGKTMPGEHSNVEDQNTIVQKCHGIKRVLTNLKPFPELKIKGCIFIVRNPRDAILAEFSRRSTKSHTGTFDHEKWLRSSLWKEKHESWVQTFQNTYRHGVTYCQNNYQVIFYEDLKESDEKLMNIMETTTQFLVDNNPQVDPEILKFRMDCLSKNLEGNFHRKTVRDWDVTQYFSDFAVEQLNKNVKIMNSTLNYILPESYLISDADRQ